jgi:hypothetical protein
MFRSSPSKKNEPENDQFYFLPREPGMTSSVVDEGADGREIEAKPADTAEEAFEPKPVNRLVSIGVPQSACLIFLNLELVMHSCNGRNSECLKFSLFHRCLNNLCITGCIQIFSGDASVVEFRRKLSELTRGEYSKWRQRPCTTTPRRQRQTKSSFPNLFRYLWWKPTTQVGSGGG